MNKFLIFSALLIMSIIQGAMADVKINFEVSFTAPQTHYALVAMDVSGVTKDYVDLKMPVWTPGSYLVREFAKNVEGVRADASGNALKVEKVSKNTWRVYSAKQNFRFSYSVYCFEISVRTPFVDASHAFLAPAGVFMYPAGMIAQASTVTIKPYKTWSNVSTGLEPVSGAVNTFYVPDFDQLYDSPIEVGNQDVFEFNATGTRYEVAMYGGGNYDKARMTRDMTKIIEQHAAIFGENPNKRYVFLVHNYIVGSGGLEHSNSTVLGVARGSYDTEAGYLGFLRLVSHEHFHLWNVKRLRPQALGPFNYDQENYTTNLWIAEGFTTFYDKLAVHRAGFMTAEKYVEAVLADIGTVENQPGNRVQSASEASYDAWIKQYRPNENSKNTTISYYNKGALIALVMNFEILYATNGQKSLDDVMRAMYDEYYKKLKRGYTDAEFRAMAEKVAGKSLAKIYDNYVNGTAPIAYNEFFEHAGLRLIYDDSNKNAPYLGIATAVKDGKTMVTNVMTGTAGWNDGINVNDEIIAIDGERINPVTVEAPRLTEVQAAIVLKKPGDKINIMIARDGLIQTIPVTLLGDPNTRFRVVANENVSAVQAAVRKKWLRL